MTDAQHWPRLEQLFHEAAELPTADREALLENVAREDPSLADALGQLLDADEQPNLIDRPILPERPTDPNAALVASRDGEQIGPYRIVRRIAAGGMGVVYLAERTDGLYNFRVAIKLIRHGFDSRSIVRRFHSERQALANLNHPNIARLLDGGTTDAGEPYLVMEYVDGRPIDEYCDEQQLSVNERLKLFAVVCHAVHSAHQNLVIHRDLKPSNILITDDEQPKLLDFGIAKLLAPEQSRALDLAATERLLTPDYASPEQIKGTAVTTSTDIYSLGVILYRLLTGRRPYRLTSVRLEEIERAICEQPPTPPSVTISRATARGEFETNEQAALPAVSADRLRRTLRGDLDNIVLKALRKEHDRRYASAEQFAEDIDRYLKGLPVIARRDTMWYRTVKFMQRHRTSVAAAALFIFALVGGIIGTATMAHLRGVERDAALVAEQRADREAALARAAEVRAQHEADHAQIEAESAHLLAGFLTDAFLVSAPTRTEQQLADVRRHLNWIERRIRRQYEGQRHLQANLFDALGHVYLNLHLTDDAYALIQEAADIRVEQFGPDSIEAALSHASLCEYAHAVGNYADAVDHCEQALRIHRTAPEGVHTDVAHAANNLGVALRAAGRLQEAEQQHLEALRLRREAFGEHSVPVAESLDNLAHVYMQTGRLDEAAALLTDAVEIRSEFLGEQHPLTAQTHNNLATVYGRQQRFGEAAEQFRLAVEALRLVPHAEPVGLAQSLKNLSRLTLMEGDVDEAQRLLTEAVDTLNQYAEPGHPLYAALYMQRATILQQQGAVEEANDAWQRALDAQLASPPRQQPATAMVMLSYGVFLVQQQRFEQALPLLEEAVDIFDHTLPEPHATRGIARASLGRCLMQLGRTDEARSALESSLDELEATVGSESAQYRTAQQHLAELDAGE